MYCNQKTKDLAIAKGYKQCTCGIGYPMCICEKYIYSPIRLDDLQRWLRDKDIHCEVNYRTFILTDYNGYYFTTDGVNNYISRHYETYYDALEAAILRGFTLIKD